MLSEGFTGIASIPNWPWFTLAMEFSLDPPLQKPVFPQLPSQDGLEVEREGFEKCISPLARVKFWQVSGKVSTSTIY